MQLLMITALIRQQYAAPVYVGNELELRSDYIANSGTTYFTYLHTEMLPLGEVTHFQIYTHDTMSPSAVRCIRIHIFENDPPMSPVYFSRWQYQICTDLLERILDIPVNERILVKENYYLGWTVDAQSDSPVTLDRVSNGKTLYTILSAPPADNGILYFTQPRAETWSIGVTIDDVSKSMSTNTTQATSQTTKH